MKVVRKVFFWVFLVLFGSLLSFNVYQFICTQFFHQPLPTFFGYGVLEVVSGSMEPTIHVGDLIVINTNKKEAFENNIITFTDEDGAFITHRVVSVQDNQMVTRGDNNNSNDPAISIDTIVGTYEFRLAGLGILLSSLRNPFVMFMIFVVGILVCYYFSLDSEGNLILSEDEKEYQEFLEYQKEKESSEPKKDDILVETKESTSKKTSGSKIKKEKIETSKTLTKSTAKKTSGTTGKKTTPRKTATTKSKSVITKKSATGNRSVKSSSAKGKSSTTSTAKKESKQQTSKAKTEKVTKTVRTKKK